MKTTHSKAILASLAFGILAHEASATITFDLRATAINGIPIIDPLAQKNPGGFVGDMITLDVYAVVTGVGGNVATEGFTSFLTGDILSGTGGDVRGNFLNPQLVAPFNSGAVSPGTLADLDLDGDIDLGSNNLTFVQGQHITIRAASVQIGNADGVTPSEFRAFTTSFQITSGMGTIPLQFRMTNLSSPTSFEVVWREDGLTKQTANPTAAGGVLFGNPVMLVAVPEPSAFGMVLLGAMGIVGFRRIGVRRS